MWDDNFQAYGARKAWHELVRGNVKRTTIASDRDIRPLDLVHRRFIANRPNQLWVADFMYIAMWKGFVYVAFVIDVFSRMIVHLASGHERA